MKPFAAALLLLSLGCNAAASEKPPPLEAPPARSSLASPWVKARAPQASQLLEAPALVLLDPAAARVLSAPLRARVERVHRGTGAPVRKGEPVLTIASPELAAAAAAFVSSQARLAAHGRRVTQLRALEKDGLSRLQDLADAEAKLAECEAERRAARALLRAAGIADGQAAAIAEGGGRLELRSPFDGVVVSLEAVPGESFEPGARLARLEAAGRGVLEARLPAALVTAVGLVFTPHDGVPRPVRLSSLAPSVDPRDGSRLAWLIAEGPPLPAGTAGRIRGAPSTPGAVLVPASSLAWGGGEARLVVRSGGKEQELKVRVLAASGAEALIAGDVRPGDEVAAAAGSQP
jgi:membrane fusion protein, heavy metal efflux system